MTTDAELQNEVRNQLDWEPLLGAARIGVRVSDDVVVLTGQVDTCPERSAAERAARRVAGARTVISRILVVLPKASQRSDADIARSARQMLHWMTSLPPGCVQAAVENGWITLSGRVRWAYQRQAAVAAVRYVVGTTGVTDHLVSGDGQVPAPTRLQIDRVLNWRAASDPATPAVVCATEGDAGVAAA
jgi:osmotically-inducible protein OsmY